MKKVCPECGFELQEGDVFCMNCGASLDEEEKPVEQKEEPKKKFNPLPLIIVGGVLVVLIVAALIIFNKPQAILIRSGYKLSKELNEDETLQRFNKVLNGGSVELSAEAKDIIGGFNIPLISQIDASASVKYYMNQKESSSMLKVTGSLGGTDALGADFWISPTEFVVKSNTLLGKKAYGIDFEDTTSRNEAKSLLKEYLNIDADGYDDYLKLMQAYTEKQEVLSEKLSKQLVKELIKNAEWDKDKDEIDINGEDVDTTVVYMTIDKECLEKIYKNLYKFAKDDSDFEEVMEYIDRDEIEDAVDDLDDDFKIKYKFFIDKDMNLVRQDSKMDGTTTRLIRFPEGEGFELKYDGEDEVVIRYDVEKNDEDDYESTLSVDDYDVEISWNKNNNKWQIEGENDISISGTMHVNDDEINGAVNKVEFADQSLTPNVKFKVKNEDKMPELPNYKSIKDDGDVEELINSVKENVMGAISQFIPNLNLIPGLGSGEEAKPEPEFKNKSDSDSKSDSRNNPKKDFKVEDDTKDGAEFGSEISGDKESDKDKGKSDKTDESTESGLKSENESETETDTRKTVPVSGTYMYDDGNQFSIDFNTGEITPHIQCIAELKEDGTYTLSFSNGMMDYEDKGTYKRFEDDTMEFESESGINATGKYKQNSIEVSIAGYGSVELPKKK